MIHEISLNINNQASESIFIKTPWNSLLNHNSLLSFSTFFHSVWIMQNGEAVAAGRNWFGEIMSTMPKDIFIKDTKIEFRNKKGYEYTLYKVSGEMSGNPSQLVYAHSSRETIFLNIGKLLPVSLFGGWSTSAVKAACCNDSVIVIGESGRIFECRMEAKKKSFSEVVELSGIIINEISGTSDYFFAVSEDGRVFG